MKRTFALTITLPGKHLLTFEARNVVLPSKGGYIGFMAGRQPLLATMEPGLISLVTVEDRYMLFGTTGGFAEMLDNQASLLCDSLIEVKDLDLSEENVPTGKLFNRESINMSETQKREYVKQLMIRRLHKTSAVGTSQKTAQKTE
ncbi:MAG: F0F1 ATP synthase subunit epsilon [Candidatus Riflebacteria bacterium]|nr:F0F1 ATP synthase subunit epsilon [Candidatus Riflebacteria bacterium]